MAGPLDLGLVESPVLNLDSFHIPNPKLRPQMCHRPKRMSINRVLLVRIYL